MFSLRRTWITHVLKCHSAVGPAPRPPTYFAASYVLQLANRVSKFGASDSTRVTARNTHCLWSEGND